METIKLEHVVGANKKYNQVNDLIDKGLKFDSSNSLANNPVKYPQPIVTIRTNKVKYRTTAVSYKTTHDMMVPISMP